MTSRLCSALLALVALLVATPARSQWIPTNVGNGADAEVRESNPTQNRGTSTEIASRILDEFPSGDPNDGLDRNSLIYLRFDLSAAAIPADVHSALRLTYRNNNLLEGRISDTQTPDPLVRTGIAVYGLDPAAVGAAWMETTITYLTAPGLTPDGDVGTRDLNGDLVPLGSVLFPFIGSRNWLPVGGELIFESAALDTFVDDAVDNGATEITLVVHALHDAGAPSTLWLNFNYLFNPKEQVTLNDDPNYDADVGDPGNPLGSPWSGADNSAGDFSPALLVEAAAPPNLLEVPTASLGGLAGLAVLLGLAGAWILSRRG